MPLPGPASNLHPAHPVVLISNTGDYRFRFDA
jgi:hypothetical protein